MTHDNIQAQDKHNPKNKSSTERKQFFTELLQNCSQEDVYSVRETAESMNVPYELVEEWADKNKRYNRILQRCRAMCSVRINEIINAGKLDWDELQKLERYRLEVDDEQIKKYEEYKKQKQLEHEAEQKKKKAKEDQEKEQRKNVAFMIGTRPSHADDNGESNTQELITAQENQNTQLATQQHEQKLSIAKERLVKWKEKEAIETLPFSFKKNKEHSTEDTNAIEPHFGKDVTTAEKKNILASILAAATGTASIDAGLRIYLDSYGATPRALGSSNADIATGTQEALLAMAPNDIHEGMLCSRIWALHNQAMHYLNAAAHPDANGVTKDANVNRATKLMRLHNETLEALNRYRRKGEQKVTVQHVNVNEGGQAIVAGQVTTQG